MVTDVTTIDPISPFEVVGPAEGTDIPSEGAVRYLLITGKQDDGLWGPVGAVWLSEDGERGGFLVHPWALFEGSDFVRGYRSARERGWTPRQVYEYWEREVWPGTYTADEERRTETLSLLHHLLASL